MTSKHLKLSLWQFVFLAVGMTWLLAPSLNHVLSARVTLISEYEVPGQPWSLLFRSGDVIAGLLIIGLALWYRRHKLSTFVVILLIIIGIGSLLDPLLPTNCVISKMVCYEQPNSGFLLHAAETVMTSGALLIIIFYDALKRRRLVSISFAIAQIAYGLLYLLHFVTKGDYDTLTQYIYQCGLILWLAWFGRDFVTLPSAVPGRPNQLIRLGFAAWIFLNGLLAIAASTRHVYIHGSGHGLYFATNTAWLAQHGIVTGVIMLYIARHLYRGELRARQLTLVLLAVESIKYALISPRPELLGVYFVAFGALFASSQSFQRGSIPMTVKLRIKDACYMLGALAAAVLVAILTLHHEHRLAAASRAFGHILDHNFDKLPHAERLEAVLFVHTATVFIVTAIAVVLWAVFRPYKVRPVTIATEAVEPLLKKHARSSEDFFKLWPADKHYFWNQRHDGFIAYKITGSVAFALDGPICQTDDQSQLIRGFATWAHARRLKVCFLLVAEPKCYEQLNNLQIGASARINIAKFTEQTSRNKWWRWKYNRAIKQGYNYQQSQPPHATALLTQLRSVSDDWLAAGQHQERGFALGYYEEAYLQRCPVHYLQDNDGQVVAFANQLPTYNNLPTATVDLIRYKQAANDAMPYLLAQVITAAGQQGYSVFDLGFVPFAKASAPLVQIAKALTAAQFSARGLEQFKNKFEPEWRPEYIIYDGDVTDLAAIALNLEKSMQVAVKKDAGSAASLFVR